LGGAAKICPGKKKACGIKEVSKKKSGKNGDYQRLRERGKTGKLADSQSQSDKGKGNKAKGERDVGNIHGFLGGGPRPS